MIDYSKLTYYRRGIRPVQPDSLPVYVDRELDRVSIITASLVQALKDLDARVTALEP